MMTSHHECVFAQAWAEHQQIRHVLAEIRQLLASLPAGRAEVTGRLDDVEATQLLRSVHDSLELLRRALALEGANGEVAIALACVPDLDGQVSATAVQRAALEQQIDQLAHGVHNVATETHRTDVIQAFLRIAADLQEYLSSRSGMLRRSLIHDATHAVL
jgi:hypothetical protein